MISRVALITATLILGVAVLLASVVKASAIEYNFDQKPPSPDSSYNSPIDIAYNLAYPGTILPDNLLWPLKVVRDKMWLGFTFNPVKKSELLLLMADKRLAASEILFKKGKSSLATSVLTKAEKYLDQAAEEERTAAAQKKDTSALLGKISMCSLKHRQVIDELMVYAPEDAKPRIIETQNYSKNAFTEVRNRLLEIGAVAPKNPFNN